jgi:ABC-type polysaccharide/polyol phosphate transport system ATPase subunit
MSEFVIDFDHVWKGFPLRRDKPGFKELMVNIHRYAKRTRDGDNYFYALKDLTLRVERGECVGIIGRNGAGKTTLLSLMLGTISPSEGKVRTIERVTPLLELGGGFHPDLTGRENVILNGVLLGLTKEDVLKKLSSIVDFSGIGEFVDFPMRTYSSGMYLRLAFSVAIHTDPRILIIDEVLSVGDEEFQKKSKGEMIKLIKGGITTVFVSHDLHAIQEICHRVLWLDHGELVAEGEPAEVIKKYREGGTTPPLSLH